MVAEHKFRWCQYLSGNSTEDSACLEIVLANTSSVSVFRLVAVFLLRPSLSGNSVWLVRSMAAIASLVTVWLPTVVVFGW